MFSQTETDLEYSIHCWSEYLHDFDMHSSCLLLKDYFKSTTFHLVPNVCVESHIHCLFQHSIKNNGEYDFQFFCNFSRVEF